MEGELVKTSQGKIISERNCIDENGSVTATHVLLDILRLMRQDGTRTATEREIAPGLSAPSERRDVRAVMKLH